MYKKVIVSVTLIFVLIAQFFTMPANITYADSIIDMSFGTKYNGEITSANSQDIYKITVPKAGKVKVSMSIEVTWIELFLMDSGNSSLDVEYTTGDKDIPKAWSKQYDLEAGTYYFKVEEFSSMYLGKYSIQADYSAVNTNDKEPNNTRQTAQALPLNANPISGYISMTDAQDIYKIDIPKAGKYILNMKSGIGNLDGDFENYDGSSKETFGIYFSTEDNPKSLSKEFNLNEGTYYIKLNHNEYTKSTGIYTIQFVNKDYSQVRYAGQSRFETAVKISNAGWSTSNSVVLANAYGFADALTGVSFAYIKNAPILLTETNSVPKATSDEIKRLGAKNIYILGGIGVISQAIEEGFKKNGYNVFRIAGATRFETAAKIGNEVVKGNPVKTAVLTTAYNYPDALAISSYAAINKIPVLYTEVNTLDANTMSFIKNNGITKVIIPGGTGAVSQNVETDLKNSGIAVERAAGQDRYSTALKIVTNYRNTFKSQVMLATGSNFPDALAGGVLAAKMQIPILLVEKDNINSGVKNYIKGNFYGDVYILGGTGVVSDNIINILNN